MAKSPDAFRTISEAALELDLPQHVLRFWETRFAQIKPMKRAGGRRYYRTDDIDLLRGVKLLLYDRGYTIKGVQKLLKEKGVRYVTGLGAGEPFEPAGDAAATEAAERAGDDIVIGATAPAPAGPGNAGLSSDDRDLLNEVLMDLLECKRVLDQAR